MDWQPVVIALIVGLPPTILALATLIQGIKTHATFNSKMDLMLKIAQDASFAAGQKAEADRQKEPPGKGANGEDS